MSVLGRYDPRLQSAIAARLGWTRLRPVQEAAGNVILDGENAIVLAPTAGGKTEAALFPLLTTIIREASAAPRAGVSVLYLAPMRALLNNQSDRFGLYSEMLGLRRFVWHGDTSEHHRKRFLKEPTELLLTTPESLEVMLFSKRVDARLLFAELRAVIVDEIHALAGDDRGAQLMSVLERIARLSRHDVQRVGLSATVSNPEELLAWLKGSSMRSGRVVDPPRAPMRRQLLVSYGSEERDLIAAAASLVSGKKSFFFCQSRAAAEAIAQSLRESGTEVFVHHSAVSREERQLAEARFQRGEDACIVCTSTLELGIDVGDLDLVMQIDAPPTVSSFLQRMGRTGRREGQAANTSFFCGSAPSALQAIALVELAREGWIEAAAISRRNWTVLIHQLLMMALGEGGITSDEAWMHLSGVADFSEIERHEYERLLEWMLANGSLRLAARRLVIGTKVERRFGHKNFMELFAVFTTPTMVRVERSDGTPIGTLDRAYASRLGDEGGCFLLGGRPWVVREYDRDLGRMIVDRAHAGEEPAWSGALPQLLSFEIAQRIKSILISDERPRYVDAAALQMLESERRSMRAILEGAGGIDHSEDELRWWTFAGGKINAALAYAFEAIEEGWSATSDNFLLRLSPAEPRGRSREARAEARAGARAGAPRKSRRQARERRPVDEERVNEALAIMREPALWESERFAETLGERLPSYRLSKLQPLMPPWIERELLRRYFIDEEGARLWVRALTPRRWSSLKA